MASIIQETGKQGAAFMRRLFAHDTDPYKQYEKNITFVGTRGASKTTALGCIALTCQIESTRNPKFTFAINEKTSGICQVPADLCQGKFPPATPAGSIYEANIDLTWQHGTLGTTKTVRLPFAETAGEDIENIMVFRDNMYGTGSYVDAANLNRIITASHGYVVVAPVTRSTFPIPQEFDKEPASLHRDADLNVARILQQIFERKRVQGAKPAEGVAVLLTKYDMVDEWLKSQGMNLFIAAQANRFLTTWFRQTMGVLKNYGLSKVQFFPVFVQVQKRVLQDGSVECIKWPDGSLRILVDRVNNLPYYSMASYQQLLQWLGGFAG